MFLWTVIAGLYGDSHERERVSHYLECGKEFNLRGISFPMALKDIPKFEKVNNDSIPVYEYQEGKWEDTKILVLSHRKLYFPNFIKSVR